MRAPHGALQRDEEEGLAAAPSIGRATAVEPNAPAAETEALRGLYERHHANVLRFCHRRLGNREEAEDAAQTTFYYALGGLRRGVVPASETAWLLTIARNVCLNRWDATRRRGRVEVARDPQLLQEVAPGRPDADGSVTDIEAALRRLPEQQRRAILLREWQGLSYADIAAELGVSRSAVETLIFRARKSLARELSGGRALHRGLDVGSLVAGAKSLLVGGGATVKILAGAAALATAGALTGPMLGREPSAPPPARVQTPAVATPATAAAAPAPRALAPSAASPAARRSSPGRRTRATGAAVSAPGVVPVTEKRAAALPRPTSTAAPRTTGPDEREDVPTAPGADIPAPQGSPPPPRDAAPSAPPVTAQPAPSVPSVDVPRVDPLPVDPPPVDVPPVDLPPVDAPVLPPVDPPAVDVPPVDVPPVDLPAVPPVSVPSLPPPPPLPKLP